MFSVCSTAPIDGTARYAARCSALFHMKVPTRWSPVTPMRRNAFANCAVSTDLSVGVLAITVVGGCGDFARSVHAGGVPQNGGDRQRKAVHGAVHRWTA